jgi:hypothetical protein
MCAMAAVISAQIVEGAAGGGCFEAGKALHGAGRVTGLEPVDFGASGLVADGGTTRDVWVGIRYRFLVGECDCADAATETTSDSYLQAAADGEAGGPELCAHAVAVALAAIGARLPWAPAPAGHQPRHLPITRHFTTPPPPLDITTVFPELSALAATTVRLHPRAGRPGMRDSSLGGPLLWPASEPWPVCTRQHLNQELVDVPREITSWDGADAWAAALDPRARVSRYSRRLSPDGQWGPSTAVIDYSGPPDPPSPLIGVVQIYARDVPDLPFPDGADLFQLLWCPNEHNEDPWFGPWPAAFWRRSADVTGQVAGPPEPLFDNDGNAASYDPAPCLLHPEHVTEYPHLEDLADELQDQVRGWDEKTGHLYWSSLGAAPGTKALGHPNWIQPRRLPTCERGHRMQHLVTIANDEYGWGDRWVPAGDGDDDPAGAQRRESPHGLQLQRPRLGAMYLFTCTTCPHRPVNGETQS